VATFGGNTRDAVGVKTIWFGSAATGWPVVNITPQSVVIVPSPWYCTSPISSVQPIVSGTLLSQCMSKRSRSIVSFVPPWIGPVPTVRRTVTVLPIGTQAGAST